MAKDKIVYDHRWRLIPTQGRNWASDDYIKYTTTHKIKKPNPRGGRMNRKLKMSRKKRNYTSRRRI